MTNEQKVARLAQALKDLVACVADEHDDDYDRTCSAAEPNGCTLCDARRALEEINEPTVLRLECRNTLRLEVANPQPEIHMSTLSKAQRKVLTNALSRPGNYACPTRGLWAAASMSVLNSLQRNGLIDNNEIPRLTEKGIETARAISDATNQNH